MIVYHLQDKVDSASILGLYLAFRLGYGSFFCRFTWRLLLCLMLFYWS